MDLNTQGSEDQMAMVLRNAVKLYGKKEPRVLDELNMTVPRGCIYCLLGASGVGKTTALNVMIGLLKLDSGQVKVLGVTPGKEGGGIPGTRLGYMPQEHALIEEFTIQNLFFYFGWIYGMTNSEILDRMEFLSELLELPPRSQLVTHLSGGQKRRLSFSVAVMHNPDILILDEPTVGQDPILRNSIWNYMLEVSEKQNKSIIITTHYIEEARAAHKIGFLRNGKLLTEGSPNHILARFNCDTLENVSLLLSQRQTDRETNVTSPDSNQIQVVGTTSTHIENVLDTEDLPETFSFASRSTADADLKFRSKVSSRISAVLYKNWWKFIRNIPGLLFFVAMPAFSIACFIVCIGGETLLLPIGIVNEELGNCFDLPGDLTTHSNVQLLGDSDCQFKGMSCLYVDKLNTRKVIVNFYDTIELALEATRRGHTYSSVYLNINFTSAMQVRQDNPTNTDEQVLDSAGVKIWMDMTDFYTAHSLRKYYLDKYKELQDYISEKCNYSKTLISLPIRINPPVYGFSEEYFTRTMTPGYVIAIIMLMALVSSVTAIISEKVGGTWRRNMAIGLSSTEILLAHLITQVLMMLFVIVECLILCICMTDIHVVGSGLVMLIIMLFQGLVGVALGIFVSSFVKDFAGAYVISCGIVFCYFFMGGSAWPTAGMHPLLRYVSYVFPSNSATDAINSVIFRGWGLTYPLVYSGILISLFWLVLLVALSILSLKYTSS